MKGVSSLSLFSDINSLSTYYWPTTTLAIWTGSCTHKNTWATPSIAFYTSLNINFVYTDFIYYCIFPHICPQQQQVVTSSVGCELCNCTRTIINVVVIVCKISKSLKMCLQYAFSASVPNEHVYSSVKA